MSVFGLQMLQVMSPPWHASLITGLGVDYALHRAVIITTSVLTYRRCLSVVASIRPVATLWYLLDTTCSLGHIFYSLACQHPRSGTLSASLPWSYKTTAQLMWHSRAESDLNFPAGWKALRSALLRDQALTERGTSALRHHPCHVQATVKCAILREMKLSSESGCWGGGHLILLLGHLWVVEMQSWVPGPSRWSCGGRGFHDCPCPSSSRDKVCTLTVLPMVHFHLLRGECKLHVGSLFGFFFFLICFHTVSSGVRVVPGTK